MNWLMNLLHRLGAPRSFFEMTGRWLPWTAAAALATLAVGVCWALLFAPQDYQQGHSVRIMYVHVPAAMLAQSAYLLMATAAILFLVWRIKLADVAMKTIAPIGASLAFLALATGAIWGKPTWGAWWAWGDARLTSTLVLFFLYIGVMALRSALSGQAGAARACAILAVVGVVNLPIIRYSVDWWHTLHQPSSFSLMERPAMPVEMWLPLLVMAVAYYLLFFALLMMRMRNEILVREQGTDWVRQWFLSRPRRRRT